MKVAAAFIGATARLDYKSDRQLGTAPPFTSSRARRTMYLLEARASQNEEDESPAIRVLNAIRINFFLRVVTVLVTMVGWFVISNHCALGGLVSRAGAKDGHGCCQNGAPRPAQEPADSERGMQCCKSLSAVVLHGAKVPDLPAPVAIGPWLACVVNHEAGLHFARVSFGDTGPPSRALSFSELVLHRSLRSHAPPFLA